MQEISAKELKNLMSTDESVFLLDVRDEWEFETCQIAGTHNIPMADIASSIDGLDQACKTVVICHHGMRSHQVANFLEQQGFEDVLNLSGGIHAWAMEVDLDMPKY